MPLAPLLSVVGALIVAASASGQNITSTVAPNENGSDNYVDIECASTRWYFYSAPTPSAASMSRISDLTEYPWGSVGNFQADSGNEYNRIFEDEFLRVYPGACAAGTVIQIPFAYSPSGTMYDFEVTVTAGAQVTSLNITDPSPTSAATVNWQVVFDQSISGVTAANFAFNNPDAITDLKVTSVTPVGSTPTATWNVAASTGSGTGILGLNWAGHVSESPSVPNSFVGEYYDFSIYPVIEQDLTNATIDVNTTIAMTIGSTIRGTATLNYQWYSGTSVTPSNAIAINGATSSSYTPPTFTAVGSHQYFCRVYTTTPDYTDSSTENITVVDPPAITSQPANAVVSYDSALILSVAATGTSLNYQWYQGVEPDTSSPIGADSQYLVLFGLTGNSSFWVHVYNGAPVVANSASANITVVNYVLPQPANYSASVSASYATAFSVKVEDSARNVVSSVPVTFTAPAGGASGSFAGTTNSVTVNTSAQGIATAPAFTGNGVAGAFNVVASYGATSGNLAATNFPVLSSGSTADFLTAIPNSFNFTQSGLSSAEFVTSSTLPPGVTLSAAGVLSGTPPVGSGGTYPMTIVITNSSGLQSPQSFTLTVFEKDVVAARPSFNTNGLGWALNGDSINGGPIISGNGFVLTDLTPGENRSGWFRYPLYVGDFQASFYYVDIAQNGADGMAFVIQDSAAGTTALGAAGGALGYGGITNSVAVLLNLYSGSPGGASGIMLGTNGVGIDNLNGSASGRSYENTAPVNIDSGDVIHVNLFYTGGVLNVTLEDLSNNAQFQTAYPVDIPAMVTTNVAWVGLTGSEGGVYSLQDVTTFSYEPLPTLSVDASNNAALLTWPGAIVGFEVQGKTNLSDASWVNISTSVSAANGTNQILIPATNGTRFYRLSLP